MIVSMVRTNQTSALGFLGDPKRANVAITRGRYGTILIGDADCCFQGSDAWVKIISELPMSVLRFGDGAQYASGLADAPVSTVVSIKSVNQGEIDYYKRKTFAPAKITNLPLTLPFDDFFTAIDDLVRHPLLKTFWWIISTLEYRLPWNSKRSFRHSDLKWISNKQWMRHSLFFGDPGNWNMSLSFAAIRCYLQVS